jgi:hypothetical protein
MEIQTNQFIDLYHGYNIYCSNVKCITVPKRIFYSRIRAMGIKVDRKSYGMVAYLNNKF